MLRNLEIGIRFRNLAALIATATLLILTSELNADRLLSTLPAIELAWTEENGKTAVSISNDGQEWMPISATRRDGSKAYWIARLEDKPQFARKTFADPAATKGDQLVVDLEAGVRQLKVEIFDEENQEWRVQVMAQLDGKAGAYPFRLKGTFDVSKIRLSSSNQPLFDFSFTSHFEKFGTYRLDKSTFDTATARYAMLEDQAGIGFPRVEESDIWRIHGNRLFFFNQLRGLQVIDLTESSSPLVSHFLSMPTAGQQMYAPDENFAILLSQYGFGSSSELLGVEIDGDNIEIASVVEIPGQIFDSRMVGNVLYTAAYKYERVAKAGLDYFVWNDSLVLSAVDFSDRDNPRKLKELTLPDASAVLTATPEYLIIASRNWRFRGSDYSDVYLFAIDDPNEPLKPIQSLQTEGTINDKFKMSISGDVLTCISHARSTDESEQPATVLETFAISPSNDVVLPSDELTLLPTPEEETPSQEPMGRLVFAENESLFATRILDDKAYIVTFLRIDPLWVIDLSDPANPSISGELEIPGWSTYLQPIEDQLFAVGVEDRRVSISLFDVANPAEPFLRKRIYLGDEGDYTWSEANYDEKAISILPEQNLALIPFVSYDYESNTSKQNIQLIDFTSEELTLRGVIDSDYQVRRATMASGELVSISNRELLVFDTNDRDAPQLSGRLPLAWTVDEVFVSDDNLLQIEYGNSYFQQNEAYLRVTSVAQPFDLSAEVPLGEGRIAGTSVRNGILYCLFSNEKTISIRSFDVSDINSITEQDSLVLKEDTYPSGNYVPTWIDENTLVWNTIPQMSFGWWGYVDTLVRSSFWPYSHDRIVFLAIDTSDPQDLDLLSVIDIPMVSSEEDVITRPFPFHSDSTKVLHSKQRFYLGCNETREVSDAYEVQHCLKIVDFSDPENPSISDPMPVPGNLQHLHENENGGIVFFTTSDSFNEEDRIFSRATSLQASVFDGENVFLLDEIEFEADSLQFSFHERMAFALESWFYYYGIPEFDQREPATFSRLTLNEAGRFETLPSLEFDYRIQEVKTIEGSLFLLASMDESMAYSLKILNAIDASANPEIQEISLDSYYHSLESLSIAEDKLLFANGVYGVSVYSFEPPLTTQLDESFAIASYQNSDQIWKPVSWISTIRIFSDSSPESEWSFANDAAIEALPNQISGSHSLDPHKETAFKILPALEIPWEAEQGRNVQLYESHDLENWIHFPLSEENKSENSCLIPLDPTKPVFLRIESSQ